VAVDLAGFETALEAQRERSRSARPTRSTGAVGGSPNDEGWRELAGGRQQFVGYERTEADTGLLAFREQGDRVELVLRENPFYVESGGQVSDTGVVRGDGWELPVDGVRRSDRGTVLIGRPAGGFEPTDVSAIVDRARRRNIERNHSATHLVHWALRRHLGPHVRQQGSLVDADRLRFDFSHHGPIDPAALDRIERDVNEEIWANLPVDTREMAYPDALALGAMAFFADKYGDRVRVVTMGPSIELCGGTHVGTSGALGVFRFTGQSGVAAGVRRIEAVTGPTAYEAIDQIDARLAQVAELLKAQPDQLARRVEQLLADKAKAEERLQESLRRGGGPEVAASTVTDVNGVALSIALTEAEDRGEIAQVADRFRDGKRGGVLVLFAPAGKGAIHVALTDDLVQQGKKAGDLANRIAAVSGGKGGGRPAFASASAGEVARLGQAREATPRIVAEWLTALV
jgi:alanyl-tRNA synthetase